MALLVLFPTSSQVTRPGSVATSLRRSNSHRFGSSLTKNIQQRWFVDEARRRRWWPLSFDVPDMSLRSPSRISARSTPSGTPAPVYPSSSTNFESSVQEPDFLGCSSTRTMQAPTLPVKHLRSWSNNQSVFSRTHRIRRIWPRVTFLSSLK